MNDQCPQPRASRWGTWLQWQIAAFVVVSCGTAILLVLDFAERYYAEREPVPARNEPLNDHTVRVEGSRPMFGPGLKGIIELPDGGKIEFEYCPISDSGAHVERIDQTGTVIWSHDCHRLGVDHDEYRHKVFAFVEGSTIKIVSRGSLGTFVERLDLDSGKRIARGVRKRDFR